MAIKQQKNTVLTLRYMTYPYLHSSMSGFKNDPNYNECVLCCKLKKCLSFWLNTAQRILCNMCGLCLLRESTNMLEAASQGASNAVALVANIVVNLIAFLALLAFFDGVLSWLGGMLDCPQLSFSVKALTRHTCTYALWHTLAINTFKHKPTYICTHTPFASLFLSFS